jgi:hypothetical protein
MMLKALLILLSAGFTAATAWAMGCILLQRLRLRLHPHEEQLFGLLTGYALLSLVVFLLAACRLAYNAAFLVVGLGALAWRGKSWNRGLAPLSQAGHPRSGGAPAKRVVDRGACPPIFTTPLPPLWAWFFWTVYAAFGFLYLMHAMAPEMSPDGSSYHLGLVARYLREHRIAGIPTHMYANLSQGMEMLFLFAFAFGRHSAAALVHCSFLLALPLLILSYARRFGLPRAGAAAALFVFASPVAGVDGASAYNDVAVAAVVFTCFYLVQIWSGDRAAGLPAVAGLLAGFAFALKYTAFLALPYTLGFLAWKLRSDRGRLLRAASAGSACALLMALPWLAKNVIVTGNPVAPFFNGLFPNPYVDVAAENDYSRDMQSYVGLKSYREAPLEVTLRGEVLAGLLGPLFLLAPAALGALFWPAGRSLLAAGILFLLPYPANVGTRFLLPALPFFALAMAMVFERVPGLLPALVLAHGLASWPGVTTRYCARYAWRLDGFPIRAALRLQSEEDFLTEKWPGYRVAKMIERHVPPGEKVFALSPPAEAYCSREVLTGDHSTPNRLLREVLWVPVVPGMQPVWVWRFRFGTQSFRRFRLVQTAAHPQDQWSITELRIFDRDAEVPRDPAWKVAANSFAWEAPLAVDNSAVTRWSSHRAIHPGMYFEIVFPKPVQADAVLLQCVADQYRVRLRLEGETAEGQRVMLGEDPEKFGVGPPLDLRRMAAQEFLARGIRYIVMAGYDVGAKELREHTSLWDLALLAEESGTCLYRITEPRK